MTTHDLIARIKRTHGTAREFEMHGLLYECLGALETLQRERDEAVLFADRYKFLRRRAVMVDYSDDTATKVTLFKEEGPTGEFLDDWVDGEIAAISTLTKPADGETS